MECFFFFLNLTCRFSSRIFQWALMTIKIVSMMMLHVATERAGPWPTICAGGGEVRLINAFFHPLVEMDIHIQLFWYSNSLLLRRG